MMRISTIALCVLLVSAVTVAMANGAGTQAQTQPAGAGAGPAQTTQPSTITQDQQIMQDQQVTQDQGVMQDQRMMMNQTSSMPGMAGAGPGMAGAGQGMMMCPMAGNIAVDDRNIYVLRGNELVTINKRNMQVASTTMLPPMTSPATTAMGGQVCPPLVGRGPEMRIRPQVQQQFQQMQRLSPSQFERQYMETIIDSHAGAIAWSRLAATRAQHPELQQFAQSIIQDESRINQQFSNALQRYYNVTTTADIIPMDQQVLNSLQNLSGRDFEVMYMRAMINHLSEAVVMSRYAAQTAPNSDVRNIANSMANEHAMQIQQLQNWMSQWYGLSM